MSDPAEAGAMSGNPLRPDYEALRRVKQQASESLYSEAEVRRKVNAARLAEAEWWAAYCAEAGEGEYAGKNTPFEMERIAELKATLKKD